jgi:hypothetical protein
MADDMSACFFMYHKVATWFKMEVSNTRGVLMPQKQKFSLTTADKQKFAAFVVVYTLLLICGEYVAVHYKPSVSIPTWIGLVVAMLGSAYLTLKSILDRPRMGSSNIPN